MVLAQTFAEDLRRRPPRRHGRLQALPRAGLGDCEGVRGERVAIQETTTELWDLYGGDGMSGPKALRT